MMLKIKLSQLNDASLTSSSAISAILEEMQNTISDGEIIEIEGNEPPILRTQEELDEFLKRFN